MNGRTFPESDIKPVILGVALSAISFMLNLPYVTLTLLLAGYVVVCDRGEDGRFLASFLAVLALLYNLRLHGIL